MNRHRTKKTKATRKEMIQLFDLCLKNTGNLDIINQLGKGGKLIARYDFPFFGDKKSITSTILMEEMLFLENWFWTISLYHFIFSNLKSQKLP